MSLIHKHATEMTPFNTACPAHADGWYASL